MYQILVALCMLLLAVSARAEETTVLEEGAYSINGKDGQPKHFAVARVEDKWEIKSTDPTFPLRLVNCVSNCEFRPMPENLQQNFFPQFKQQFVMRCISNSGFALCKMMNKPLLECGNSAVKIGEACRIGPDQPEKPLYGLFVLFAPAVMPIPVTRLDVR